MTPEERYEAWREAQLEKLKQENALPEADPDWHGCPWPRARARRRA